MDPERWKQIDGLLRAAFELPEDRRSSFLEESCRGDLALRREVERLLAADEQAEGFLETAPFGRLEDALAETGREDLPPSSRIGRYVIQSKVGEGGMGRIYTALDPELDRIIAIKLVQLAEPSGGAHQRLLREAQALARVSHPNVVTVYDAGSHEDGVFLAMEYVSGGTLEDWLRSAEHDWREILNAFLPAARGLAAAHAAGIVHRDFKPSNVLRDEDGRLRVADFGLARAAEDDGTSAGDRREESRESGNAGPEEAEPSPEPGGSARLSSGRRRIESGPLAHALTRTHWRLGTPSYMAPEQHEGAEISAATDQFSFCVALYQALYREHPFGTGSPEEIRRRVCAGRVAPPPPGSRVPGWLRKALLCGLAVRPGDRWASMDALLGVLERGLRRGRLLLTAAAVTLTLSITILLAVLLSSRPAPPATAPTPAARSVAILPFDNIGPDPEDSYLSEGITDGLISSLVRAEPLQVPNRTSVYGLRGRELTIPEIASNLRVGSVVEGTVRRSDDQLRVAVHLIDAPGGSELWTHTYDRPMGELFALQEELARDVIEELKIEQTADEPLFQRPTESLQAYGLYLRGRSHWNQRSAEGLRQAVDYFKRAIAADDRYALAYAGLADAYSLMPTYDPDPDPEALTKAQAAARRALELDPRSAEAHASLATILMRIGELDGALEELRQAVELEPRYATARHWYGLLLLRALHRPRAAVSQLELARRLDPASSAILSMLAGAYYLAGMHGEALDTELELRILDPEWTAGGTCIARSYIALGQLEEAVKSVTESDAPSSRSTACQGDLALAYHLLGDFEAELAVARRGLAETPQAVYLLEAQGGALAGLGRVAEVEALFDRVLAAAGPRDFSRYALYNVVGELRVHGHIAAAREMASRLVAWHREHFPDDGKAAGNLTVPLAQATALIEAGRPKEAAKLLDDRLAAAGIEERRRSGFSDYRTTGTRAWMAALAGRREAALRALEALDGLEPDSLAPPYAAFVYAALGERAPALQALEDRLAEGLVLDRELHAHVGLAPLMADPALHRLLPARGLPSPRTD